MTRWRICCVVSLSHLDRRHHHHLVISFIITIIIIILLLLEWRYVCHRACVESEGSFVELILSFQFYTDSQDQTQVSRFAEQTPLPSKSFCLPNFLKWKLSGLPPDLLKKKLSLQVILRPASLRKEIKQAQRTVGRRDPQDRGFPGPPDAETRLMSSGHRQPESQAHIAV